MLKWIAECENNSKYWADMVADPKCDLKVLVKAQIKLAMWKKRITILRKIQAEQNGQEASK